MPGRPSCLTQTWIIACALRRVVAYNRSGSEADISLGPSRKKADAAGLRSIRRGGLDLNRLRNG